MEKSLSKRKFRMLKKVKILTKTVLSSSILILATSSQAAMTLEEQVSHLQRQVLELQTLIEKRQDNQKNPSESYTLKNKPENSASIKNLHQLMTKGGAEFELYGNVRADASYQFKGPSTMYNYISSVPLKNSVNESNNSDKFQSTINVTRFGLNFKAPKNGDHSVAGKVEMDFFGGAGRDSFRIRHAYLTYDQWLIGQTWSNFNAIEYFPETVDASLSVGGSLTRVPQVKYTYSVDKNLNLAFSLEDSKAETVTTSGTQYFKTDANAKLKLPSAVGRLNYKFDNVSSVSGRFFVTQKSTNREGNDDFIAWGAALGGKYQITENTLVRFDYNHIKGDSKNVLWSNYAYVFDENNKMKPNEFDTATLGITQKITPKIRSTLGFGYMRAKNDNSFAELIRNGNESTQNKELMEGWVNIFYNPVKSINFGVEYMYGERKTFTDEKGIDNRINFTAIYEF